VALAAGQVLAAPVQLSPEAQHRLGIVTQRMTVARQSSEIDAFAKVLDPAPLVQTDSDLRTAVAAAAVSSAQAKRSQTLHAADGSIAAKDVEAAASQARQDALKVALLRRQLGLAWGPGVVRLSDAARGRLVHALANGSAALVHVDTHNNDGQAGARFVKVDIGDGSARGLVIGPARQAEPRLQSSGLIVEVTGPQAVLLSVGLTQSAHIESSSPQSGVLAPRSAVVRFRGASWVYVRTGPQTFERRLLSNPVAEADGFFVAQGLAGGEEVVTQGAQMLFAAEQNGP
jgi:L-lactate utilization protein LutC